MKHSLQRLLYGVIASIVFINPNIRACGFDFVGSCATAVRFTANNVPKDYFVTTCAYGNALTSNIGTNLTTLQLSTATTVSWESCTNILQESAIYYRVYKDPLSKGAFQKGILSQKSLVNSPPYRTRTYSANLDIDLLAGLLPNTNYTIEIYYQLSVDSDGNGTIDASTVANNNGFYFATNFQTGNINANSGFPVAIATQNVNCNNGNNGSATATASGGTAPYTYLWSNGATGANITGLRAGNYSVTATDATNAKGIKSFSISEPAALTAILSTTNPSCGIVNGAISTAASGGTPPYSYLWSNTATTANIANLAASAYNLTVTDSKGCTGIFSTVLTENCGGNGTYCASASLSPWSEWIARVQLNSLDNASEKTRPDRFAVGYSDWTDKATSLSKGQSYPLSITPGLSWSGAQANLYFRVWIDFNKNSVFEDTEKVFERNATSLAVTSPISIPASALLGTTTMRISMKKDAYSTVCESFSAGEVEDYSVVITTGGTDPCATDAIPPTLSSCPQNISLTTETACAVATWAAPTATDNCTTTPSVTSTRNSGFCFPIGSTTVVYTATDTRNNSSTCSFSVAVAASSGCTTDAIPPNLSSCPQNISLTTTSACAIATWAAPTATDNCTTTPSVTSTRNSGFCFPIGSTTVVYTATDARNNSSTCSFSVAVAAANTGTADIGLTVTSPNTTYSNWTTINFKITAKNNSTTAFSNAKIEFKFPTGTVNGGSTILSTGDWQEWCIGAVQCYTWTIPALAANATATLEIPLFVLNPGTPIVGTAKLLSSTPTDGVTANNTASVTINPSAAPMVASARLKATQLIPVVIQQISPNPTEGDVFLELESLSEREVRFDFSDTYGRIVKSETIRLDKGTNSLPFNVAQLPQGVYFVTPSTSLGRQIPYKFVKL